MSLQQFGSLSCHVLMPKKGVARHIILLLHGLGADGADLVDLAHWGVGGAEDIIFIAPNAPFSCDMTPFGYQWFSLREWTEVSMYQGLEEVYPILNQAINAMLDRFGLDDQSLSVVGFSQGCMTALHVMLRRPNPCAAVIGFSGALVAGERLIKEVTARPAICLIHGTHDMVVPYASLAIAKQYLHDAHISVEIHSRPGIGHTIDPIGWQTAIQFMHHHGVVI
jgi:phospholipase/carboxylesterase